MIGRINVLTVEVSSRSNAASLVIQPRFLTTAHAGHHCAFSMAICAATPAWSDGHSPPAVMLEGSAPNGAMFCTSTLPRVKIKSIRCESCDTGLFTSCAWQQVNPGVKGKTLRHASL